MTTGLIIPVDVLAYCVGTIDAHDPARRFAGATTDYSRQGASQAYVGNDVIRDFSEAPQWPLELGVHLHWAMPDALTHAIPDSSPMAFPPLPTRWLVSRIVGNGQSAKHWIIQSDVLSTTPPAKTKPPSVPVAVASLTAGAAPTRDFRYLGGAQPFTAAWREAHVTTAGTLKALTKFDLHAVSTGDIAFAAFYPNARGVFGFHDDLSDLSAPAELLYVVTGWYANAANDPVTAGLTPTQLVTQLGWTLPAGATADPVDHSFYSGLVQRVQWDPTRRYLPDAEEPMHATVAIGNHPAEALAAYFRGTEQATAAYEELLALFLTGLAPNVSNPTPGQLAELDESLHELQFTGYDGGTIYTITRGTTEVTELPLPLADALNLLAQLQQAADVAHLQQQQAAWQLFAAWYRIFQVDTASLNAALNAFTTQSSYQAAIVKRATDTAAAAAAQATTVGGMLTGDLTLTKLPGPRYYAPTEPVVLLAGEAAAPAERYGGDGNYHPAGLLVCRRDSDVVTSLQIAAATPVTLAATSYASLRPPGTSLLPAIGDLVAEAALLDTAVAAAATGLAEAALAADQELWLEGKAAALYKPLAGIGPSPVATSGWPGENPWCSLMLLWQANYHPLLATGRDYAPTFFTANYQFDPGAPRLVQYAPTAQGITVDPSKISFDSSDPTSGTVAYTGASVLSTTSVDNVRTQLKNYLATNTDQTLSDIAKLLGETDISMQSLTGFTDALLSRARSLQLSVGVSPKAPLPMRSATQTLQTQLAQLPPDLPLPPLAPDFNGAYSGVRAGYFDLGLAVMDPFGRKRKVTIDKLYVADSLTAYAAGGAAIDNVVYAPPRLSQPSRLLFRWIAADSTEYDEMNAHPATTPVCGWILPNHLVVGCFLYSAQGDPLGTLSLRTDGTGIDWQATPGNEGTIDADLATVMAHQNPHLRDFATALAGAGTDWFRAFWRAIDTAVTQIEPASAASATGLAALVGRPLAITQVSLRLERQGIAAFDQTFPALAASRFADTDHATGGVQLPVVLGDLSRIDDGLVGYFKQAGSKQDGSGAYDLTKFYTEAAPSGAAGVIVPDATTVLVTPAATNERAPDAPATEQKLLLLVDPRAPVHATTAILPTLSIAIPSEQYEDALAGLEVTVPASPLLRPTGGMAVPVPAIAGYNWSWIVEQHAGTDARWEVDPDLSPPTASAVWAYSPQTLTEGWLRLNPELLRFRLANAQNQPVVAAGTTAVLTLSITNARRMPITFTAGTPGLETDPKTGSVFYIHFGSLVPPAQVAQIQPSAPGWAFQALSDATYGSYWGASPAGADATIQPGATLPITLANVAIGTQSMAQARIYFDYYNVVGDDDGIDVAMLAVTSAS